MLVDLRRDEQHVIVVVEDDGVGGADIETGTGLRGLVDRLSALDGTLEARHAGGRRDAPARAHPLHCRRRDRSDDDELAAR